MTWVMVAGCLALQLSGTAHRLLVEHAICAEHGEAIDVARPASGMSGAGLSQRAAGPYHRGAETRATQLRSASEGLGDESHHHCPVFDDRNGRALVVRPAFAGLRLAAPEAVVAPHVQRWRAAARAQHRLAPKTSPPA